MLERFYADEAYATETVAKIAALRAEGLTHREVDATLTDLPKRSSRIWNGARGRFLRAALGLDDDRGADDQE